MKMQAVLRSLPLLAAILGDRYGVKVEIGGRQAFTDGNTIHLPALPPDGDASLPPLVRGLLDHEAAHIRETDFPLVLAWPSSPLSRTLWNILEDWRVEQKLAAIYPGCRQNFDWLIAHFVVNPSGAGNKNPALSIMSAMLLTVRAWDVPTLSVIRDAEISEVERAYPGLWLKLASVLGRVKTSCRSTRDALEYADELAALIRQEREAGDASANTGADGETETPPDKSPDTPNAPHLPDMPDMTNMPDTTDNPCDSQQIQMQHDQEQARRSLRELVDGTAPMPPDLGEQIKHALSEKSVAGNDALTVAEPVHKTCEPLPQTDLEQSRLASVALRARLQRLLQARQLTRIRPGRRGRLNPDRLHRLIVGDPRVFLRAEPKRAVNAAIHILLDASGSMRGSRVTLAALACHAVVSALYPIKGIRTAVSAFPGDWQPDPRTVAPLIRFGERPHARLSIQAAGGTPLAETLWWAMQGMISCAEHRKCLLILTDGKPDSLPAARKALTTARDIGLEVYGIGIQSKSIAALLPDTSLTIDTLSELAPAMFDLLQTALPRA